MNTSKIEIVANNFFEQDINVNTDTLMKLFREVYVAGFKRGVERCNINTNKKFDIKENGNVICTQCGHKTGNITDD